MYKYRFEMNDGQYLHVNMGYQINPESHKWVRSRNGDWINLAFVKTVELIGREENK